MSRLDAVVTRAVADGAAPYVVAMTTDRDGVTWSHAVGEVRAGVPANQDTIFSFWSMTKAVGSLAVLTLVDQGQLSLDEPVASVLPEIGRLLVLDGGHGEVKPRPPRVPITLRHLLAHTSGLAYPLYDRKMIDYAERSGVPYVMRGDLSELRTPLMFDPGTAWTYGTGVDWAGYLVQTVTGTPIADYCQAAVLDPLKLGSFVFEAADAPGGVATAYRRNGNAFEPTEFAPPSHPELYGLGNALYGSAADYARFLRYVLRDGELDGVRLIGSDTFDLLVSNVIGDLSVPVLKSNDPGITLDVTLHFEHSRMTHTAAFIRTEDDVPGHRRAGTLWWAGFLNTHYWVDRTAGVAAVFMTQSLPFSDPPFMCAMREFESAVYEQLHS